MKRLIFKLILPLTFISFLGFTKWWYALPTDGPDTLLFGFPFIWVSEGWHTSMSLQIFAVELLLDVAIYFLCWFTLIFLVNRYAMKIELHKWSINLLWAISCLMLSAAIFIVGDSNNYYFIKRPFDIVIMKTGYKFVWQETTRPDITEYKSNDKNK